MNRRIYLCLILFFATFVMGFSQDIENTTINSNLKLSNSDFNPLSPAKAAFYSAVLPGLGQAYNKKYWKIPLVYAALGSGVYFYKTNNDNFIRVREAYKLRISGKPDEFDGTDGKPLLSVDALKRAQISYKKDRDLSLLITAGLYVLQVLEASTNAHLMNHNVDNNLSVSPQIIQNSTTHKSILGASINYKF